MGRLSPTEFYIPVEPCARGHYMRRKGSGICVICQEVNRRKKRLIAKTALEKRLRLARKEAKQAEIDRNDHSHRQSHIEYEVNVEWQREKDREVAVLEELLKSGSHLPVDHRKTGRPKKQDTTV